MKLLPDFLKIVNQPVISAKHDTDSLPNFQEIGTTIDDLELFLATSPIATGKPTLPIREYNDDLKGRLAYPIYDKMRLSDSQIKALLGAIKLPLLSADWTIEPADDSEEQQKIANWLNEQLIETDSHKNRYQTWQNTLQNVLLHLDYGSMPFEPVWDITQDETFNRPLITLKKLAPRFPETITDWMIDTTGELTGIVQRRSVTEISDDVIIPIDKLILFVNQLEGSNYRGVSVLRAAYRDWYFKDRFLRLLGIIIEKRGSGIDVATLHSGDATKQRAAQQAMTNLRTHEKNYLLETPDFGNYRVEGTGSSGIVDPLPSIKYFDTQIVRGLLAEFISMGDGERGSFAMHQDKTSFFLMSLRAISKNILNVFNHDLIPTWVDMNWPDIHAYPKLSHSRLDRRDAASLVESIAKLVPQGVITVNDELENELRNLLELKEVEASASPEERRTLNQPREEEEKSDFNHLRVDASTTSNLSHLPRNLELATRVRAWVDFEGNQAAVDSAKARIEKKVAGIREKQVTNLLDIASRMVADGNSVGLKNIKVKFIQEMEDAIYDELASLYEAGQLDVAEQINLSANFEIIQLASPLSGIKKGLGFIRARAKSIAESLAAKLKSSVVANALDLIRRGETSVKIIQKAIQGLSVKAILSEVSNAVNEAFNLGRDDVADDKKDLIEKVIYVTEPGPCPPCNELEGLELTIDSELIDEIRPPYHLCEGRNRCRCSLVYMVEGDKG